jgi:NCAIR mutase (PurE)-related protein
MMTLREVLEKISRKELSIEEAEKLLRFQAIEEIGSCAKIDVNREFRNGIPEIILAEGKSVRDLVEISSKLLSKSGRVIISRCSQEQVEALRGTARNKDIFQINERAKMVIIRKTNVSVRKTGGKIGILTAGTSDIGVAEEAKVLAEELGCEVLTAYDVGVAGIHRLMTPLKDFVLKDVDVMIVVAGREGALASVVAGLVDVPVVGVPTSNSFGFGEKGLSALMSMLQSCSLGLAVVNIDSGVAAGAVASSIANRAAKFRIPHN